MTRLREEMQLKNIPLELILEETAPVDDELIESISESKQFDPIKVTPTEDGKYKIIGGKRRYLAQKALQAKTILCLIINDLSEEEFVVRTLVDNSGKPNPMDEALHMQQLREMGYTNEKIAHTCRYDKWRVDWTLKLLSLIPELQSLVKRGTKKTEEDPRGGISFSVGYEITRLPQEIQQELYKLWEAGQKLTQPFVIKFIRDWQAAQMKSVFDEEPKTPTKPGLFLTAEQVEKLIAGEKVEVYYQEVGLILKVTN